MKWDTCRRITHQRRTPHKPDFSPVQSTPFPTARDIYAESRENQHTFVERLEIQNFAVKQAPEYNLDRNMEDTTILFQGKIFYCFLP